MAHKREHKLEHVLGGIDALNKETLPGIKDIIKTIPSQSDYVKFLKNKIQDFGVAGDDSIFEILEEGNYLYIRTGNRVLKVNKSDLEIVNSYVIGSSVRFGLCLTTNFVFIGTSTSIIKLNKSDLSFVTSIGQGAEMWLRTDGTYVYTTSGTDLLRFDLDLVAQGTLALTWGGSWIAAYDSGYLYIEHEDAGLTFSKIDVSTFTIALEGDLSADYGGTYVMIAMGAYLYMTAIDSAWENISVVKVAMSDLSFVAETTPVASWLQGICGDGTYLYYNDASSSEIYKIDTDLAPIENAVTDNNNYIGSCADANNIFYGATINPAIWYKYTKTSIAKVSEKIGATSCLLNNDNSFCSNGESIFYVQEVQRKLCKVDIDTFEVTKSEVILEDYFPLQNVMACDGKRVYFTGYDPFVDYGGWLFVYDANTLERIDMRYWSSQHIPSSITVDENYIYMAWRKLSGVSTRAYVDKLDKNTLADVALYTGELNWRSVKDICLTKDYLYMVVPSPSNITKVYKIDIETMTVVSSVQSSTGINYCNTGLVCPGQGNFLFYASGNYILRVNTDDMTVSQKYPVSNIQGIGAGENYLYIGRYSGSPTIEVWNPIDFELIRSIPIDSSASPISSQRHLFIKDFIFLNIESYIIRSFVRDSDISDVMGGGVKSVTLLVAASNASESVKSSADYVCDGTDDQVQLNAAIAELKAGIGGRIVLSEGLFNLSNYLTQFNGASNIIFEGQGVATIINFFFTDYWAFDMTGANNNVLQNFQIINATIQTAIKTDGVHNIFNNLRIVGIIGSASEASIYIVGGSNRDNIVSNCRFIGAGYGVRFRGKENIAENNICFSQWYSGIVIEDAASVENIVTNNFVRDCKGVGIEIALGLYNIISGNEVKNCTTNSIKSTGDYNIIVGNLVRGTGISNTGVNDEIGHNIETT